MKVGLVQRKRRAAVLAVNILIATSLAQAAGPSCESSGLQADVAAFATSQLSEMAQSLARFRAGISREKNLTHKRMASQEFDLKFSEFVALNGNREKALLLLQAAMKVSSETSNHHIDPDRLEEEKQKKNEIDVLVNKWKVQKIPAFHDGPAKKIFFAQNQEQLVAVDRAGRVKTLDLKNLNEKEFQFSFQENIHSWVLSPDGSKLLAADSSGQIQILDLGNMGAIHLPVGFAGQLPAIAADGSKLFVIEANKRVRILNLITMIEEEAIEFPSSILQKARPAMVSSLSPDGQYLAIGELGGRVRLINLATKKVVSLKESAWSLSSFKCDTDVKRIIWAQDSSGFITQDLAGAVQALDLATLKPIYPSSLRTSNYKRTRVPIVPTPDGSKFVATDYSEVAVFDLKSLVQLVGHHHHPASIYFQKFNADGTHLVTVDMEGSAYVMDVATQITTKIPYRFKEQQDDIMLTPDGTLLFARTERGKLTVLDLAAGAFKIPSPFSEEVSYHLFMSPSGTEIFSINPYGNLEILRLY